MANLPVVAQNYTFDGTNWIPVQGSGSDSDAIAEVTEGVPQNLSLNYGHNGTAWDRLLSRGNDSDNNAVETSGVQEVNCYLHAVDGGGLWDRLRTEGSTLDAVGGTGVGSLRVLGQMYAFNEATFDRQRNNTEVTLLASAARTASVNSADFTNFNAKGAHFVIDVSLDPASASITVTIEGKDPLSGEYYDILVSAAIDSTGITILKVYPGISTLANGAASDILPRTFRVKVAAVDTDSLTYSIAALLVV